MGRLAFAVSRFLSVVTACTMARLEFTQCRYSNMV
jgi:hypothetical protein